jgi:hypothetical protein
MARENDVPGHTMEGWLTHYGEPSVMEHELWWKGGAELLEFAMCAPHGTTLGYAEGADGQVEPVLEESEVDRLERAKSARIQAGASSFLADYMEIYGSFPPSALSSRFWGAPFHRLVTSPTKEEAELLGELTHSDSAGGTERRLPIAPRMGTADRKALARGLERAYWKAGFRIRNGMTDPK